MALSERSWSSTLEKHSISPSNEVITFMIGRNVVLSLEPENHVRDRDSSRASSKQLCEYKWGDNIQRTGRLLSVRDQMVAYRLNQANTGEAIRILDRISRTRHLIKDFRSRIVDLQWAVHANLLAVVDCDASLHIYFVEKNGETCEKYINIMRNKSSKPVFARIAWCPTSIDAGLDSEISLLALYYDKKVEIIDLSIIKRSLDATTVEIDFQKLSLIPDAFRVIELDTEVNSVKISPDSSALVVTTNTGRLVFYIISDKELRVAQDFAPIPNHVAEDIIFLDDLTLSAPESFWRYGVITSDSGRKLWLFDCDDFTLVGKARIDAPNATSKFEIQVDLAAKFIFVIDYDSKNMFAFEIAFVKDIPHFAAVTMIAFYNVLHIAVPVRVEENLDTTGFSLDDDEETNTNMTALFVAISPRALLEIRIDLEKRVNFEPATPYKPLSDACIENRSTDADGNISNVSDSAKASSVHSKTGANYVPVAEMTKMTSAMEDRFHEMKTSFDNIKNELGTVKLELENVKSQTRSDLFTALEGISNELRAREERFIEAMNCSVNRVIDRVNLKLEEAMIQNHKQMEIGRERSLEVISNTVSHIVVPSLELLCRELFKQLNDQLNAGLCDFNDQLKRVQSELVLVASSSAPTPQVPDVYTSIIQLIESNKYQQAFELALSHNDLSALMMVCTRINIDDFFEGPKSPLQLRYLLLILELLMTKLNHETTAKLHIAELVLMVMDIGNEPHAKKAAMQVLQNLNSALDALQKSDPVNKRQIRVVMQLATNLLKTC